MIPIGVTKYVVAAVAFAGVLGYAAIQHYRADAAAVRAEAAEGRANQLAQTLTESESDKEALRVAAEVLDQTLVRRDKRLTELEAQKRAQGKELDELKAKLPQADIDCLNRDLPDAIRERLRGR